MAGRASRSPLPSVEPTVLVVLATSIGAAIRALAPLPDAASGPSIRKGADTPALVSLLLPPPPPHAATEILKSTPKNNLFVFNLYPLGQTMGGIFSPLPPDQNGENDAPTNTFVLLWISNHMNAACCDSDTINEFVNCEIFADEPEPLTGTAVSLIACFLPASDNSLYYQPGFGDHLSFRPSHYHLDESME